MKTSEALGREVSIAVCITFHYVPSRLEYLNLALSNFKDIADSIDITVVTDAVETNQTGAVKDLGRRWGLRVSTYSAKDLGHPFLLPWSHFNVMKAKISDGYSHYLYMEDDLGVQVSTLQYLLDAEQTLAPLGLLPSVLRVERSDTSPYWYATDFKEQVRIDSSPKLKLKNSNAGFINLPKPYQAMYFLRRSLMEEHLSGPTYCPDYGPWNIRESAAQGLTFSGVPSGFVSRNVVPYDTQSKRIDEDCLIHHLPNNYANDPRSRFGKVRVVDLLI
jgi:hypothetical protein